ncbi:uncharacterized protein VTP21DRAFT_6635 [Calcarisporiella thermophila]|uniref:uncharacterized protein n=1 Tax=Calcarisporiella thermophila TaxID=911321 RepID=UPI003742CF9E
MANTSELLDVIVVGSGPVGLFMAIELTRYGIPFRIFDKLEAPAEHSRAFGILPRCLEAFDHSDIVEPFLKHGHFLEHLRFRSNNRVVLNLNIFGGEPRSTFSSMLILNQTITEKILNEELKKLGKEVERGMELVGYEQNEGTVTATFKGKQGEEVVNARYLVGCDGAHSAVRKLGKDWKYPGVALSGEFFLADITLGENRHIDEDEVAAFLGKRGVTGFFPLRDGPRRFRIISTMGQRAEAYNSNEITHGLQEDRGKKSTVYTVQDAQEYLDKSLPDLKLKIEDATWVSTFRVNERKAEEYRRGHAAHCHSPVGGQGLNIGIQDAQNLALKLFLVLSNQTSDTDRVLNSYQAERGPIADNIIAFTGFATRLLLGAAFNIPFLMSFVFPRAMRVARPLWRRTILQLNHHYCDSFLVQKRKAGWVSWLSGLTGLIAPGKHIPDGFLKEPIPSPGQDTCTLYDVLRGSTRHTVILFSSSCGITPAKNPKGVQALRAITEIFGLDVVQPMIVAFSSFVHYTRLENPSLKNVRVLMEISEQLHKDFGVADGQQALVVVRPDLYVASAGYVPMEVDDVIAHMGTYLKSN